MKIEIQKQSKDFHEISYSENTEFALVIDGRNSDKDLSVYALQRLNNDDYIVAGILYIDNNFILPAEVEFSWQNGFVGYVIFYHHDSKSIARFDFQNRKGTYLEYGAWLQLNNMPKPEQNSYFPVELEDIRDTFFHTRGDWSELTVKKPDGYWKAIDDWNHKYSFVIETESKQCVVYACNVKPLQILSANLIPRSISFPFKLKLNFENDYGVFVIGDDSLIAIYNFKKLSGIVILPYSWLIFS